MDWPDVLRSAGYESTTWRNGTGTTLEVAAMAVDDQVSDFRWRVSIADVAASGRFSEFPGVDRIIIPLDSAGLHLSVDGFEHRLSQYEHFAFPGEAATSARLTAGPTRDLNIMCRRDLARATVEILQVDGRLLVPVIAAATTLLVSLAGQTTVSDESQTMVRLEPLDAAFLPKEGAVQIGGEAVVAVVISVF